MSNPDTIDNVGLVINGLFHIGFEVNLSKPSYFRIARESHLVLYRSMIESLKGTANLSIIGRPSKKREHVYQFGGQPIKRIRKQEILQCAKAWRFSTPEIVDAFPKRTSEVKEPKKDFLIPFYDALAMIQAECFMGRYGHSSAVLVSDHEMATLEWLNEAIRNEYEHFIPKLYQAEIHSLSMAAQTALEIARKCLFDSGNVSFFHKQKHELKRRFGPILETLEIDKQAAAG